MVRAAPNPVLHSLEHRAVGLIVHVPESGVVEDTHAVVQNFMFWDIDVLPCVEDPRGNVLQDSRAHLTSWLVQDVGEVVLRQERVSGIGAVGISPWLVLVFTRRIDDPRGSSLKRLRRSIDERTNEWREERHDEDGQSLRDLVNNCLQAWDLLDDGVELPNHLVAESQDGVNLSNRILRVEVWQPWLNGEIVT